MKDEKKIVYKPNIPREGLMIDDRDLEPYKKKVEHGNSRKIQGASKAKAP